MLAISSGVNSDMEMPFSRCEYDRLCSRVFTTESERSQKQESVKNAKRSPATEKNNSKAGTEMNVKAALSIEGYENSPCERLGK